jgi:outer membrane protein assembly factor BamB
MQEISPIYLISLVSFPTFMIIEEISVMRFVTRRRLISVVISAFMIVLTIAGLGITHLTAHAASLPGFNNKGISDDSNRAAANYDTFGNSYSNNALIGAGFKSGTFINVHGLIFQWPIVADGRGDNWITAGHVVPVVGNSSTLAFLGSATSGPSSGTAIITYTNGSTQTFTLTFSDWTLNGGKSQMSPADAVAAMMSYRNRKSAGENIKTYLFYTSIPLQSGKTIRSVKLPTSTTRGQLHVFAVSALRTELGADWPTYDHDLASSGFNKSETTLTAANVNNLRPHWTDIGQGGISTQVIEQNGVLYWGSWNGTFHATLAAGPKGGSDLWSAPLGLTANSSCFPTIGIASTATFGTVGSTQAIFVGGGGNDAVGGGNDYLYALNANTGQVIWKTVVGTAPNDYTWSSPIIYNGSVYYGMASLFDCPLTRGRIYQINLATGAITNTFYTVASDCVAGGIWGSPTIDTATGMLFVTTGTPTTCTDTTGDYSMSLVELKASDLSYVASWQVPASQALVDTDFGSAPTLFTATINGATKSLVGVVNKNGLFYTFDRSNIAAGPLWEQRVAITGNCPECGGGSISPAVWDGSTLYVAGGITTISGKSCAGSVRALDPATGKFKWEHCTSGHVVSSLVGFPGVILDTSGKVFEALDARTGAVLFSATDAASNSLYYSPPSVANGQVYVPNFDGSLVAFGL